MLNGSSRKSKTYDNDLLAGDDKGDFQILHLEIWGLGWRTLDWSKLKDPVGSFFRQEDRSGL